MIKKKLCFDKDLIKNNLKGIKTLSSAVKSTLGPGGNPVMIERKNMSPLITKDGVTVARNIALKNSFENLAAQSLIEIAEKTNVEAGDGTTTAIVLAEAIYEEGLKHIEMGTQTVIGLSNQIHSAAQKVVEAISKESKKVKTNQEVRDIGIISSNGDKEIGKIIAEAIDEVGQDGLITVEEGGFETSLKFIEGFKINRGYISPHFVMDQSRKESVLEDVSILMIDSDIHVVVQIIDIFKKIVENNNKPFLLIANDIKGEAQGLLIVNFMQGRSRGIAIKSPGFGPTRSDMLQDIAILTGGKVISPATGDQVEKTTLEDLGFAKKVIVRKNETIIIGGRGCKEVIEKRVKDLKGQVKIVAEHAYDRDNLRERISRLTGGAAVIGVGATTELEMKEKKDRIEDALNATRAAIEEGIVPGGGVALLRAVKCLEKDDSIGAKILSKVIEVPFRQILENAGESPDVVKEKVLNHKTTWELDYGFDSRNKKYGSLFKLGVIDPLKVVKSALLNAVSIASLLLTCRVSIVIDEEAEKKIKEPPFYANEEEGY